jgi:hypothetical protein
MTDWIESSLCGIYKLVEVSHDEGNMLGPSTHDNSIFVMKDYAPVEK